MKTQLFEAFAEMIDDLPAKGILKAIERERQMLKDDLLYKRVTAEEVASIFSFCEFIKAVTEEDEMIPVELPEDQVVCFRKIVRRLVEAGELPVHAEEQFDLTFFPVFLKALAG
ncbi:MAG TPA: hypothetical protein VMD27_09515 [Candidatus Aquilonibacter sp.]|nr:hypothetical protein [Candidatus Aquilonibacter sp.]